jgi:hypothetical protein
VIQLLGRLSMFLLTTACRYIVPVVVVNLVLLVALLVWLHRR